MIMPDTAEPSPHIYGLQSPPEDHRDYALTAPEGEWTARLDYLRWGGKSNNVPNLLCYFTDQDTGEKYFFSGFKDSDYGPRDKSISFRHEMPGMLYRMKTAHNARGKPIWLSAERLEQTQEPE